GFPSVIVISISQAIIQSIAMIWAIRPKFGMNFARPSLRSLPIQSYVVFGAAAYFSSALLLWVQFKAFPFLPAAKSSPYTCFIFAMTPLAYSVGVSCRIDLHLLRRGTQTLSRRLIDGFWLSAVAVGVQIIVFNLLSSYDLIPLPRLKFLW